MTVLSSSVSASAIRTFLLASTLVAGSFTAHAAVMISTTGVISSGSDPFDLFGAGTSLAGDSYSLSVYYNTLGPAYFTSGGGLSASDIDDPITGYVTATIGGTSLTTALLSTTSASLEEDLYDLFASNNGTDAAGNFADVSQDLTCNAACVSYADLQTPFSYVLSSADFSLDSYTFTNAARTETVTFTGTPSSVTLTVPEPASWVLLAGGLFGLGVVLRRRST